MRRVLPPVLAVALLALLSSARARAAGLEVSPVQINLSQSESNALVSLRNDDRDELRYRISVFVWGESPSGEMQLGPTSDIIFFPQMVTLRPGEQRNLRVGTQVAPAAREKTYRIFIEQLPPAEKAGQSSTVRVLSRIGLPIFVAPVHPELKPGLAELMVRNGAAVFTVRNEGTVHFRPSTLRVTASDANGVAIFSQDLNPWYVLPGGDRIYEQVIPVGLCGQVRQLKVEAAVESKPLAASLVTQHGACAR